jgi:threonine aldolase
MLAKGRLLGVQFDALMENNLYFDIAAHAIQLAEQLRKTFDEIGAPYLVPGITNQVFPILSDKLLAELSKEFCFTEMERVSDTHRAVRFCTSWATTRENMDKLCQTLRDLAKAE